MAAPAAVLNVLVTANTGGASASLTRLDRQLKGTAATAKVSSDRVAKAAKYMGVGVAAGLGASVAAAAKFESAFAEVRKTVDASERGFARIRRGLLDLSTQIPESANELANLAGEAGALGIASKDIVRFTKTAAQLGTTTNLASEDAATALARLSNILNVKGRDAFERMGSVLVDLGNKGASTEREITEMSLRIARGAATIGLSAKEVLGLSASLANIGIRADAGGTAVSRALLQMNESVKEGGEQLETFAKVSGMTTDEFSALFKKSAPEALDAFARGLKDLDKEGKPLLETLKTVQLNEIRVRDALLGLGSASEGVAKSQNVANKAWRENNALSKEARQRYATFESQLRLLKNSIVKLGIDIGTKMLPDLKDMVGILRDPKLTLDQKVEQLGEKLGQMIGEWAPKVAKAVAKVGAAMAKGLANAFLDAPIWGKLIMGGLLIRAIGGRGAVLGLGAKIGGWLGIGTAAGMAGRGGAAAGAAAGAGIGAKIGGVFKNIKWARVGVLGAGIAAGSVLLKGLEDQAARGSEDIFERINAQIKRKSFLGMTSFLGDQDVFGLKVLQEGAPELQGMVNHPRPSLRPGGLSRFTATRTSLRSSPTPRSTPTSAATLKPYLIWRAGA